MRNKERIFLLIGISLAGLMLIFFLVGLFATPFDPYETNPNQKLVPPSSIHIMGTDNLGRDVFSRCLVASGYTLLISFAGIFTALSLGLLTGFISGYYGGVIEKGIMLISNSIMCFPGILLGLVAVAIFEPSLMNIIFALGLVFYPTYLRVIRTGVISLKSKEYIMNARIMGVPTIRIMVVHMLPNLMKDLLPAIVVGLSNMTLFESSMSYLGLGIQPPKASYGKMLAEASSYITSAPWLCIFPALLLVFYVVGLYFISEGIRLSFKGGQA